MCTLRVQDGQRLSASGIWGQKTYIDDELGIVAPDNHTSESWKDKQSDEKQERTEWHNVVFFNRLGEITGEYLKKGSKVYVEGSLRTRKWQDKTSGQDRYTTEIVASEMQMLDSKGGGGGGGYGGGQSQNQGGAAPSNQGSAPAQGGSQNFDDFDDDIPF